MSERATIVTQEIKDRLIKAGIAVDEEHIVMGSAEVIYLQSGVRIRIESQRTRETGKLYASIAHRYGIKAKTKIVNETKNGKFVERVVEAVRQFLADTAPLVSDQETMCGNAAAIAAATGGKLSFDERRVNLPDPCLQVEVVDVDIVRIVVSAPTDVAVAIIQAAREILDAREHAMAGCQQYRSQVDATHDSAGHLSCEKG
ncbi:MAG: hypothetical protein PHI12_12620 [Dehalococcoidales bacterium]|nr:hypothetical protein [Dehalococcoidales bacterium]